MQRNNKNMRDGMRQLLHRTWMRIASAMGLTLAPLTAYAGTVSTTDPFYTFVATLQQWLGGGLGVGLALSSIAMGAVTAVATHKHIMALGGVALAAFIHWGPEVVLQLITNGAVLV